MTVLVCGGRDFRDPVIVYQTLDRIHGDTPITAIIHGAARGADSLAQDWALSAGVTVRRFPADWEKHGKAAGPIRNRKMLDERPDLVVAFPGGRGTADMVRQAKGAGVKVIEV